MQRRLASDIDLMYALRPEANEILQYLGMAQASGLVYNIETVVILGGDQRWWNRRLQLHLQRLQVVINHRLMQILCGILRAAVTI